MSSHILQLPQEIVDKIIDDVDATSRQTGQPSLRSSLLENCALACRAFIPRSQYHLFSEVTIDSSRINSFHAILTASPHIANYVRVLELRPSHGDCNWIWKDQQFMEVMDKVTMSNTQLQALKIRTQHGVQALLEGELLLRDLIQPYMSPFITSLDIDGLFDVPAEVVTSCRSLTSLRLRWTTLVASSYRVPLPLRLQKFEYTYSSEGLWDLLGLGGARPQIDISGLRVLSIGIEPLPSAAENLNLEQKIIEATFGSLERLHISKHAQFPTFDTSIDLKTCSKIRFLEFDIKFELNGEHFAMISKILSSLPESHSLEYFRLVARIGKGHRSVDSPELLLGAGWYNLCSQIQNLAQGGKIMFCLHFSFVRGVNMRGAVLDGDIILPSDMLCDPNVQNIVWKRFTALQAKAVIC